MARTYHQTADARSWSHSWEFELILVLKSKGYRMVGDHIAPLTAGDLVLVGSDLPHIWKNDPEGDAPSEIEAILLQFDPGLLSEKIIELMAFVPVRRLLERAGRGLHFVGATRARIAERLEQMLAMPPFQLFIPSWHLSTNSGLVAPATC